MSKIHPLLRERRWSRYALRLVFCIVIGVTTAAAFRYWPVFDEHVYRDCRSEQYEEMHVRCLDREVGYELVTKVTDVRFAKGIRPVAGNERFMCRESWIWFGPHTFTFLTECVSFRPARPRFRREARASPGLFLSDLKRPLL